MTTTALILVDIQNDYFSGGRWPVAQMDEVSATAARLLAHARRAGHRVLRIRHEAQSDTAPFFRKVTVGAEPHASVAPIGDEPVVIKNTPSSFRDTDLQDRLDGITDLVICGAMSQMCIDATARAGADLGYGVTVISDASGAKEQDFDGQRATTEQVQAAIMAPLAMAYGKVITTDAHVSEDTAAA